MIFEVWLYKALKFTMQEGLDPERSGSGAGRAHNSLLYRVWGEKTNLLANAAALNPFSSSYFLWLDIGAVRESGHNNQVAVTQPSLSPSLGGPYF